MKDLIKKRLHESLSLDLIENMLVDEDYPTSFNMEEFKSLHKFSERVRYCEKHLKKISSGSARIVYLIDNTKVLKLAKNTKGIAQCETEIQWGQDYYFAGVLAQTLDSHPKGLWVEMELAKQVKASDFKRLYGFDFVSFGMYLRNKQAENKGRYVPFGIEEDELIKIEDSEFVHGVIEFMINADSPAADLARLNSYGLVNREGQDSIVLIDFGLTGDIYSTYYDKHK